MLRSASKTALLGSILSALVSVAAYAQAVTGPSFVDTFDHFSKSRWQVASDRGGLECPARPQNVALAPGALALTMNKVPGADGYGCAGIYSWQSYGFGTFEARLKAGKASGTYDTFFLFEPGNQTRKQAQINTGIFGQSTDQMLTSFYYDTGNVDTNKIIALPVNAAETPVDIAISWFPDRITWYVNGKQVRQIKSEEFAIPQAPMRIVFNIQHRSEGWLGPLDIGSLPVSAVYERVAFTAAGENCQFPESVVCTDKRAAR